MQTATGVREEMFYIILLIGHYMGSQLTGVKRAFRRPSRTRFLFEVPSGLRSTRNQPRCVSSRGISLVYFALLRETPARPLAQGVFHEAPEGTDAVFPADFFSFLVGASPIADADFVDSE